MCLLVNSPYQINPRIKQPGVMEETDQRPVLSQLRRTLFKQIVNNEFHSLRYCGLQSVTLSWLADYGRLQFIQRFVRGQIDSKIRSYLTACLITSVSRDILFYCLLCVCVYVCLCVIVLIQPVTVCTEDVYSQTITKPGNAHCTAFHCCLLSYYWSYFVCAARLGWFYFCWAYPKK